MKTFLHLVLVLTTILVSNVESKDFCESFKENGYKIDFAYNDAGSNETARLYIGSEYWQFKVNDTFDQTLNISDDIKLLESYSLMLSLSFNEGVVILGAWVKSNNTIVWFSLLSDTSLFVKNFDPSFIVMYRTKGCFGQQIRENQSSEGFRRSYECFRFNYYSNENKIIATNITSDVIQWINNNTEETRKVETLRNIDGQHRIIGMFPFDITAEESYGQIEARLAIVYQIGQTIVYCVAENSQFIFECEDMQTVIDCGTSETVTVRTESQTTTDYSFSEAEKTETMATPDSDESDVLFYVIMGVIAVIVVILVVGAIFIIAILALKDKIDDKIRRKPMKVPKKRSPKGDPISSREKKEPEQSKSSTDTNTEKKSTSSMTFEVIENVDYSKPVYLNPDNDSSSNVDLLKV